MPGRLAGGQRPDGGERQADPGRVSDSAPACRSPSPGPAGSLSPVGAAPSGAIHDVSIDGSVLSTLRPLAAIGSVLGQVLLLVMLTSPVWAQVEAVSSYGPVRPGETLWEIAGRLYPGQGFGRDRIMLSLMDANPRALSPPCNLNGTLKVGALLKVPESAQVAALEAGEVQQRLAEQRRQWAEHRRSGRPIACPSAPPMVGEAPVEVGAASVPEVPAAEPPRQLAVEPPSMSATPETEAVEKRPPAAPSPSPEPEPPVQPALEPPPVSTIAEAGPVQARPPATPSPSSALEVGTEGRGGLIPGLAEREPPLPPGPRAPAWALTLLALGLAAVVMLGWRRGASPAAAAPPRALPLGRGDPRLLLPLAALAGVLGAGATVVFREGIHLLERLAGGQGGDLVLLAEGLAPWERVLYPSLGGVVAGLLLTLNHRLRGGATTDYMEAVAIGNGRISVRHSLVKGASSLVSVASGGSIGREGAMVQLAAMISSALGRLIRRDQDDRRLLVAAGAAAGLASAYNAPLAATLFVAEIVLGSIALEHIGPLVVAAVIANVTVHQLLGYAPVFVIPPFSLVSDWELGLYLLLGIVAGHVAPLFLRLLERSSRLFAWLPIPLAVRLGLGGLVVGLVSSYEPQVWGNGYSVVNSLLHTPWAWQALATVLLLKLIATAATYGSGAVGGVFTPTLFVGASLGALVGTLAQGLWPGLTGGPSAYAVVGMGALLVGATHAPLMSILMVYEMTRDYQLVLPLMLAVVSANYIARRYASVAPMYAESLLPRQPETAPPVGSGEEAGSRTPAPGTGLGSALLRRLQPLLLIPQAGLHPLARLRSWHRLVLALLCALVVGLLPVGGQPEARYLAAWLAGVLAYLVIVWWGIGRLDADQTRLRASSLDPGGRAIYSLIVATAVVSLGGVLLVADSVAASVGLGRWGSIALAGGALAVTWVLIQTVFALRYARGYYQDQSPSLDFPGLDSPNYRDFAYFSAVIGMTSQVADVGVAEAGARRLVLLHGVISFFFNLLVLALMVNLLANVLGSR